MRKTDITKLTAIKNSVLDLNQSIGLSNMTTAKIAKNAGVSPATIYLHYQDKTDLLSRLYEEVKTNLHVGLDKAIDQQQELDVQIKQAINYIVSQYRKFPKQAAFMGTLWSNQELLDEHAVEFGNTMESPLADLFERIQASPDYVKLPRNILEIFFSVPTLVLETEPHMDAKKLNQLSEMIIKAIKK
ncbi:MAG TPA: TetR/AcrR family transcriptional regulator [Candidatus Ligilactobacillus excrementipullorum]|nr:TetR/AcrR family transcriptional regulator [Candidatus Ligilactobacillus excrementipullorum]